MTTVLTRYLAAVDGGADTGNVIAVAVDLAKGLRDGAELHIVHVVNPAVPQVPLPLISPEAIFEEGRTVLDDAIAAAGARFAGVIVGHLRSGSAAVRPTSTRIVARTF